MRPLNPLPSDERTMSSLSAGLFFFENPKLSILCPVWKGRPIWLIFSVSVQVPSVVVKYTSALRTVPEFCVKPRVTDTLSPAATVPWGTVIHCSDARTVKSLSARTVATYLSTVLSTVTLSLSRTSVETFSAKAYIPMLSTEAEALCAASLSHSCEPLHAGRVTSAEVVFVCGESVPASFHEMPSPLTDIFISEPLWSKQRAAAPIPFTFIFSSESASPASILANAPSPVLSAIIRAAPEEYSTSAPDVPMREKAL